MDSQLPYTHIGYADESHQNIGRVRGVALVTLERHAAVVANGVLEDMTRRLGISELKWSKLRTRRTREAASEVLEYVVSLAGKGLLRADILTWDVSDSRHKRIGRDDTNNLQRMYYHLLHNVMRTRWPSNAVWRLCPDEQLSVNWDDIAVFLEHKEGRTVSHTSSTPNSGWTISFERLFTLERVIPCVSSDQPIIQVADILVGMSIYSRMRTLEPTSTSSRSSVERDYLVDSFSNLCLDHGLRIDSNAGLRTQRPKIPINFWWYTPQHYEDRAPTRGA